MVALTWQCFSTENSTDNVTVELCRFGLKGDDVMGNVAYARAYNNDHQLRLLLEAASICVTTLESDIASLDIKKHKGAVLRTVEPVSFTSRKDLLRIKGISEAKVDKIMEAVILL
ncbi:hypothetical protein V6N13_088232 [Hibiscus sabdariffa]|uniref:Rad51-like C-terminal domain-containing protein n=1 Tax=Hibiscus sabdariffa TaxID=183260 RepID=A0ABR2FZL6_9ROSI